jgi:hypothetical protein
MIPPKKTPGRSKRTDIKGPGEVRVLDEVALRELDDVGLERGPVRGAAVRDHGDRLVAHADQRAGLRVHQLLDERAPDEADAAQNQHARLGHLWIYILNNLESFFDSISLTT